MPSTPRLLVAAAAGLACANAAPATIITLSQFASDGLDPSVFNATIDFVVDPLMETLTVTVTNTTVAPDTFNINRIYFNGSDQVRELRQISFPTGWVFEDPLTNGFGTFDFAVGSGPHQRPDPSNLTPGNSIVFVFEIRLFGGGPVANVDFIDAFSTVPPEMTAMTQAAQFIEGPGGASAFGARIPAPGSLVVLGIAGVLLTGRRRRR